VNAAILLMASAVTAGQPPAAEAAPAPAPPVVVAGSGGCSGGDCGPVACGCDVGCKKVGLLDKIKSRLGGRKQHCGCDAAPACAPAPAPACAPACDDCGRAPRVSILDRLKAKFGKRKGCDTCAPACDGCGAAPAAAPAAAPTTAPTPAPMPPRTTPAPTPPKAGLVVPGTVTPVSGGARLTGTLSPY